MLYILLSNSEPKDGESLNILDGNNYSTLDNDEYSYQDDNNFIVNKNDDVFDDEVSKTPFEYPKNDNIIQKIFYFICFPLNFMIYYTIPNLKINFWKKFYPLTFFISLIWLTLFSYIMVWMITIIGKSFISIISHLPNELNFLFFFYFFLAIHFVYLTQ